MEAWAATRSDRLMEDTISEISSVAVLSWRGSAPPTTPTPPPPTPPDLLEIAAVRGKCNAVAIRSDRRHVF